MLTIFAVPKPFRNEIDSTQCNAIESWIRTNPGCEVMLLGDDYGVEEVAGQMNVVHFPNIQKNVYGTPLLSSVFHVAQQEARYQTLMYINADIILLQNMGNNLGMIKAASFLITGRRWDLDIKERLDLSKEDWVENLLRKKNIEGRLHGLSGMDYFIFPRHLINMPPFAVGRPGWDSWLIYHMKSTGIPIIDATQAITIIHQNHDFSHSPFRKKKYVDGPEFTANMEVAGGYSRLMTLRDADMVMDGQGPKRAGLSRRLQSFLLGTSGARNLLAVKRRINHLVSGNKA